MPYGDFGNTQIIKEKPIKYEDKQIKKVSVDYFIKQLLASSNVTIRYLADSKIGKVMEVEGPKKRYHIYTEEEV